MLWPKSGGARSQRESHCSVRRFFNPQKTGGGRAGDRRNPLPPCNCMLAFTFPLSSKSPSAVRAFLPASHFRGLCKGAYTLCPLVCGRTKLVVMRFKINLHFFFLLHTWNTWGCTSGFLSMPPNLALNASHLFYLSLPPSLSNSRFLVDALALPSRGEPIFKVFLCFSLTQFLGFSNLTLSIPVLVPSF